MRVQYSQKDLEFLGRQVAAGQYVRRPTFVLALALALVVGLCAGYFLSPSASGPSSGDEARKRPLTKDGAADMGRKGEILQSILRHEEEARKDPGKAEVWEHLGNLYFDAGEAGKAVNAYNKALELSPARPGVLVDCGVMYRDLKQYDKALEYFRKALELQPGHEQALFNSGIVLYFDLGRKEDGIKSWRTLLRKNPDAATPSGGRLADMIEQLK
ncbi:MAG: tetratricopeptide repeat protein [Desulfovibrio sp.]|jgi:cytochrome c-type biogenesis protein CcmH/NrfG|nr:tetratricopeptide repeat protein [Desulfovibrio sp.]